MLAGLFWMLAANAAALLGAHAVLRRLRTGAGDVDALLFLLIHVLLVSATVLGAALAGVLRGPVLGIAGLAVLAALLAAGEHRHLPRPRRVSLPPLAWALAAFVVLRLLLQIWILAPTGIDTLSYHLPKTTAWILQGSLVSAPGVDFRESFPAGFELLETWWMLFLRHDVVVEAAGVELLLVGFGATACLARGIGLDGRAALAAGLLYALTPGVYLLTLTGANDPAVASLYLAAAALLLRRAPPLLAAVPAGLGIGMKATFAFAAPGLLLLAWLVRREPRGTAPPAKALWPAALLATGLGLFWYVRTTVLHGSPSYPLYATTLIPPPAPLTTAPVWFPMRLGFLVDRALYDGGPLMGMLPNVCGWGPVVFAGGIPALIPSLPGNGALRRLAAGIGLSLASIALLCAPPLHYLRFLLFVPALPILALTALAAERRPFRLLLALPVALLLLMTCTPVEYSLPKVRELAARPWRERAAFPLFAALPPGDTVAYAYGMNSMSYAALGPSIGRRLFVLRDAASPEDLRDQLRAGGARWFCSQGKQESLRLPGVIALAERAGYLRRLGDELYECVAP